MLLFLLILLILIEGFVQLNPAVTLDVNEELTLCSALPYPSAADKVPHLAPFTQTGAAAMYVKPCGTLTIWGNKTACFIARRGASSLSLSHARSVCCVVQLFICISLWPSRRCSVSTHAHTCCVYPPPPHMCTHTFRLLREAKRSTGITNANASRSQTVPRPGLRFNGRFQRTKRRNAGQSIRPRSALW